jgi:N-acetylmuramoyl-L-alanine amidase
LGWHAAAVGSLAVVAAVASLPSSVVWADSDAERSANRFDVVTIDAGHGGEDRGARGGRGLVEKELVLDVALRLARHLEAAGIEVVLTRDADVFIPLEHRSATANDARSDLFLSIHANAVEEPGPRGFEIFFLSLDASDETAERVAARENRAFGSVSVPVRSRDPLVAVLGDMAVSEYMQESDAFAKLANERLLAALPGRSRGVKQAPFIVLMGVQMPSALVEIGFLSNPEEERELGRARRRDQVAEALARAVLAFGKRYDALHGVRVRWNAAQRSD